MWDLQQGIQKSEKFKKTQIHSFPWHTVGFYMKFILEDHLHIPKRVFRKKSVVGSRFEKSTFIANRRHLHMKSNSFDTLFNLIAHFLSHSG